MQLTKRRLRIQKHPEQTWGIYIETRFNPTSPVFHHVVGQYSSHASAQASLQQLFSFFAFLEQHPRHLDEMGQKNFGFPPLPILDRLLDLGLLEINNGYYRAD